MKTKMLFCVLYIITASLFSNIINVPADQPSIQAGIDIAVDADTVLVQPGTYIENINYNGKLITLASLFLTTQDTAYISQTIIDGNQSDTVVTFESGEDTSTLLTGFTITNGLASSYPAGGGGIYCDGSSPSLVNVRILDNFGNHSGGGIFCNGSSPCLINVTISGNFAGHGGGGLYCTYSSPSLVNVSILDNYAQSHSGAGISCINSSPSLVNVTISDNYGNSQGGGISCIYSSPSLVNVTISNNLADSHGGGIYCVDSSSPSLENVTISGNSASYGGGIYCSGSSPSLIFVTISDNSVNYSGGGILCNNSNPSLVNVIISGNSASGDFLSYGGGLFCGDSSPSLVNVTITGNTATDHGGGISCWDYSNPYLVNCIMWNDSPEEIYFREFDPWFNPNSVTISYSDIQGGEAGIITNNNGTVNWLEDNIDEDPLFVVTGDYPFSLQNLSSCIDAGNPDSLYNDIEDPSNPGYALYPAMGTLHNDMGTYGGHGYSEPPLAAKDNTISLNNSGTLYNFPNPFNPSTTIEFSLHIESEIELSVFNIKGQKIKTLANNRFIKGNHSLIWDGCDEYNNPVSSGIYYYLLNVNEKTEAVKKCLLLK